jgi:hypothetical protein
MSDKIPVISIDQKRGTFTGEGIDSKNSLGLVILRVDEQREFYPDKYTPGKTSQPTCRSTNGVTPFVPFGAKDSRGHFLSNMGLSATCAGCAQSQPTAANKCKKLWSLVCVLPDGSPRLFRPGGPSQGPVEQIVVRLRSGAERIGAGEGVQLRLCDFAVRFRIEKRAGMRLYGLAYPMPEDFQRISTGKFYDQFNKFDLERQKQEESAKALAGLLGEASGPSVASVDEEIEISI